MDLPFWQDIMLRICWLLGIKPDNVARIDIKLEAGRLAEIHVTKSWMENHEVKQVCDVFEAVEWKKRG